MSKSIAIIGSMNVDLVSRVPRFLLPGETLQDLDFHIYPGGKGGNQAVAAARLTSGVVMLGKLGMTPTASCTARSSATTASYRTALRHTRASTPAPR